MGNEAKANVFFWGGSGGVSSGAPSPAGGGAIGRATPGRAASLRSTSILLQSTILIDFDDGIIATD